MKARWAAAAAAVLAIALAVLAIALALLAPRFAGRSAGTRDAVARAVDPGSVAPPVVAPTAPFGEAASASAASAEIAAGVERDALAAPPGAAPAEAVASARPAAPARVDPAPAVAGRVLDLDGGPIEGAHVTVRDLGPAPRALGRLTCSTAADGRFALWSDLAPGRSVLAVARKEGYQALDGASAVETPAGTAGLAFTLYPVATVRAQVLLDDEALRSELVVESRSAHEADWRRLMPAAELEGADQPDAGARPDLYARKLAPPGAHDLRVVAEQSGVTLAELEGVLVPPDRDRRPSVACLDLRGRVRRIQVVISDERGGIVRGAVARFRSSAEPEAPWVQLAQQHGGRVDWIGADAPVDVQVDGIGRKSAVLLALEHDAEVRLEPGCSVELSFEDAQAGRAALAVRLLSAALPAPTEVSVHRDHRGRWAARLPAPGGYAATITYDRPAPDEPPRAVLLGPTMVALRPVVEDPIELEPIVVEERPGETCEVVLRAVPETGGRGR